MTRTPDPLLARRPPKTVRHTIRAITALALLGLVWAQLAELPEVAFASGSIQPTGALRRVEHIDGGVVDTILVREGEMVDLGASLVRLADTDVDAEYENLRVREDVVQRALERNRQILFAMGFSPNAPASIVRTDARADAQLQAYEATRRRLSDRILALDDRIAAADQAIANVEERQRIEAQESMRLSRLAESGLVSRRDQVTADGRRNDVEAAYLRATATRRDAEADRSDAINALQELYAGTRDTLLGDIEASSEELALIQRAIIDNQLRRDRLWINTSVGGVVQSLYLNATGEVIEPGGIVAEILPTGEQLVAELRLKPRDIGHVDVGDRVEIRVTTYSAKRFGTIAGEVAQISATSTENEHRETFFRVRVVLKEELVGPDNIVYPVKAGMEVQASVITGSRSVLEFIAAPVLRPFQGAFGER
ncbi:MAG: HlyD family type I secretion periplasmic adaptor subunit [Pseudomonadota bacterium]